MFKFNTYMFKSLIKILYNVCLKIEKNEKKTREPVDYTIFI